MIIYIALVFFRLHGTTTIKAEATPFKNKISCLKYIKVIEDNSNSEVSCIERNISNE